MKRFIICALPEILLGWSNKGGRVAYSMHKKK
jgi:hypothetical protein